MEKEQPTNPNRSSSISRCDTQVSSEVRERIIREFQQRMSDIFGNQLLFGFICGGIANGYADYSHDIDTFICTQSPLDERTEDRYLRWYFDIHRRFDLPPDKNYPGEVVDQKRLTETLSLLHELRLSLIIEEVRVKKAIIWADMITGGIAGKVGLELDLLRSLRERYASYPAIWKAEVLSLIPLEEREIWKDSSHTLLMERFLQYPKHDGRNLDERYPEE